MVDVVFIATYLLISCITEIEDVAACFHLNQLDFPHLHFDCLNNYLFVTCNVVINENEVIYRS